MPVQVKAERPGDDQDDKDGRQSGGDGPGAGRPDIEEARAKGDLPYGAEAAILHFLESLSDLCVYGVPGKGLQIQLQGIYDRPGMVDEVLSVRILSHPICPEIGLRGISF